MVQTASNRAAIGSSDKIEAVADGSVDLSFGPKAPTG
jgi:hypothetical protein